MIECYRRNQQFKKDLPKYRFALKKWMWRNKKTMTRDVERRWKIVQAVEYLIIEWQCHNFWPMTFFIEPPDTWIKKVLTWD